MAQHDIALRAHLLLYDAATAAFTVPLPGLEAHQDMVAVHHAGHIDMLGDRL